MQHTLSTPHTHTHSNHIAHAGDITTKHMPCVGTSQYYSQLHTTAAPNKMQQVHNSSCTHAHAHMHNMHNMHHAHNPHNHDTHMHTLHKHTHPCRPSEARPPLAPVELPPMTLRMTLNSVDSTACRMPSNRKRTTAVSRVVGTCGCACVACAAGVC